MKLKIKKKFFFNFNSEKIFLFLNTKNFIIPKISKMNII